MNIARVFPRRTAATPTDELAFCDVPGMFLPDIDVVHVSVSFTWDISRAEYLARAWAHIAPVEIGGPAMGTRGEEFDPGRYLKPGYVITSRGCPNRCWFCSVWRREGQEVRELPITYGWNVLDDNLLACSESHIRAVFEMLGRQQHKAQFTGGLEAARLQPWHVDLLCGLRPEQIFFAYDTPDDLDPLRDAGKMLIDAGLWNLHSRLRAYVLCGYPHDNMDAAETRMMETVEAGFMPAAMLWRDDRGNAVSEWRAFQRVWSRPAITKARLRTKRKELAR